MPRHDGSSRAKLHRITMEDAMVSRLSRIEWCRDLINDPAWTITRSGTREPKPDHVDSFMAETLGTERTIRAFLTFRPVEEETNKDGPAFKEVRTIVEVGDGVNGHPNIWHGGFVATMLDEVFGILIILNIEKQILHMQETGVLDAHSDMACYTAYLNTNYKQPVPAPGTLLCTAKFQKREGRKIYVTGTIEDGMGTVYTTGEGMFVETIRKPVKL